jgi:hypothetical protein
MIYFLGKKFEVFYKFKEFKDLVENQTEKIIRVSRMNNSGEFYGNEFEELCKKCNIARKKNNPYTPQHNGVTYMMNMLLMEKVRCMPSGVKLGHQLWAKTKGTACYLVNRPPSSACQMTRLDMRYGLEETLFDTSQGIWL